MLVSDFDFELPESLIAQEPRPRGTSRLMVVDRASRSWRETTIAALPQLLDAGDVLVVNDTRVFPARLIGRRDPSGGAVECLLIERVDDTHWHALVHPGHKLKPGARMVFDDPARTPRVVVRGTVLEREFFGKRLVALEADGAASLDAAVDAIGHVPLPPYVHRADTPEDRERYQTIYARVRLEALEKLAAADAFRSLGLDRRQTLWEVKALGASEPLPLFSWSETREAGL
ncbi:MAG TPA: S-adenosylmethionine:tRNA ribosyltransferase-isomerase, partial [Vicinamibacterales bacterium]|nr:S-adenosylmethionine:tRNA ribosyltransferase-isomerase [Vicinamibacterales bacterium]